VNVKIPPVTSGTTRRHGKLLLVAQDRETARKACRTRNEARADELTISSGSTTRAGDNIAVGKIAARGDHARIERAARRSQADQVITGLPTGYQQMIGKRFKNGVELSGGEWQKIAIARAYMREAAVLVLDEPTAALDARSEFEVFKRFKELSDGKTAVLISHRFSSVRMADRILVLADGMVEAAGTHDELMAQPGRYSELFELQAAGYR
jgi:ATP-binding cassette, subfamily B, bacterial